MNSCSASDRKLRVLATMHHGQKLVHDFLSIVILTLFVSFCTGCQTPSAPVDDLAKARELENQIRTSAPDADFSHPAYDRVVQELKKIPTSSSQFPEAESWLKKIDLERRSKLSAEDVEQEYSYKPHVSKSTPSSSNKNDNFPGATTSIDMDAIYRRIRSNPPSADVCGTPRQGVPAPLASLSSGAGNSVVIYTTSTCSVCKRAKSYMNQRGIAYTERNIETDPSALTELNARAGSTTGVPVFDVNGKIMVGFEPSALERMLAKSKKS